MIKTLINYSGPIELEYSVRFVSTRIKYIGDDAMSSEYLQSNTSGTYLRHIWLARLCLKNGELLPFLESLSVNVGSGMNLGILHVEISVLYSFIRHRSTKI